MALAFGVDAVARTLSPSEASRRLLWAESATGVLSVTRLLDVTQVLRSNVVHHFLLNRCSVWTDATQV